MSTGTLAHRWKHDVGLRRSVSLYALIGCLLLLPAMSFFTFAELKDPSVCSERYPDLPQGQGDVLELDVQAIRYPIPIGVTCRYTTPTGTVHTVYPSPVLTIGWLAVLGSGLLGIAVYLYEPFKESRSESVADRP